MYLATLRGAGGFEKRLVVKQIRADLASDEAFVERFVAEAKTTVELSHPNIVPVYELGVEQGVYFIAMELALGLTLSELLGARGPLSPQEGAYLGIEICRALDYAHRRAGVVHRDVTPRNVLIDDEGAVRLIDFGIAAPVHVEGAPRERVFGSPGHMPVEQLRGGRLTPATDVFAVAALLVEAWTGLAPFRRATRAESDAALAVPPRPLAEHDAVLAPLDPLMARALAFDARDRPQTAEDLARPLRDFLRAEDLGDIARSLGRRVRESRRDSLPAPSDEPSPGTGADTGGPDLSAAGAAPITPATRPLTQSVTETFATRDDVVRWTTATGAGSDQASSPAPRDASRPPEPPRTRAGLPFVALLVAAAGAGAAALLLRREAPGIAPRPVTPVASIHEVSPEPARATSTGSPVAPIPPAARVLPQPSPAASEDATRQGLSTFNITSDLPARVTMDGIPQGATPLFGLRRPPGKHVITLVSRELDERLTATVDARPEQAVAVHAEFTRSVPALRVR